MQNKDGEIEMDAQKIIYPGSNGDAGGIMSNYLLKFIMPSKYLRWPIQVVLHCSVLISHPPHLVQMLFELLR
jgi:hypothetical protein